MLEADQKLLLEGATKAGEIAMKYFCLDPDCWDKGQGQGPVSVADIEIDTMLGSLFGEARPDFGILSEETDDDPIRLNKEHVFIIDPIDGTRSFLNGHENFAVSLAIAKSGIVTNAVVMLPAKGLTYQATKGLGASKNDEPIQPSKCTDINSARVLASGSQTGQKLWKDKAPPFERHFRSSLAYRLCLAAEGRFDAMFTLRPTWEWDVAAGSLICQEAGASVVTQDNLTPVFNSPKACLNGMLAGNKSIVDAMMNYL